MAPKNGDIIFWKAKSF